MEKEKLLIYEQNLNTAIQLIQDHYPNNEVNDVLEEIVVEIGRRIEEEDYDNDEESERTWTV